MRTLRHVAILAPLVLTACAGLDRNDQGNLQPQTVRGPCTVKKFFLLSLSTTPTDMVVANTGQSCDLTILNPDLQRVVNAALVTVQPQHGQAGAQPISGGFQAGISYAPQRGYVGKDTFTVTLEPNAVGIRFNVTVQPANPAPPQ